MCEVTPKSNFLTFGIHFSVWAFVLFSPGEKCQIVDKQAFIQKQNISQLIEYVMFDTFPQG